MSRMVGFLRLVRLEQQLRRLDHRVGLAAPLRVPDQPARAFRDRARAVHHPVHRRRSGAGAG